MSFLEYNGKVLAAESIDLIKYVHANFEGPLLFPTVRIKTLSFSIPIDNGIIMLRIYFSGPHQEGIWRGTIKVC